MAKTRLLGTLTAAAPVGTADLVAAESRAEELVVLDEALNRLAELDPRQSRVVECRCRFIRSAYSHVIASQGLSSWRQRKHGLESRSLCRDGIVHVPNKVDA